MTLTRMGKKPKNCSFLRGYFTSYLISQLFVTHLGVALLFSHVLVFGTAVKFNPPSGEDTVCKRGVQTTFNTRHQCITAMKVYENKSLEVSKMISIYFIGIYSSLKLKKNFFNSLKYIAFEFCFCFVFLWNWISSFCLFQIVNMNEKWKILIRVKLQGFRLYLLNWSNFEFLSVFESFLGMEHCTYSDGVFCKMLPSQHELFTSLCLTSRCLCLGICMLPISKWYIISAGVENGRLRCKQKRKARHGMVVRCGHPSHTSS